MKSEHNRGHDWPIAYEDVAPFYDKVAADIGVSGDAKAEEKWRPPGTPYPMPPMKTFPAGEVWRKGAEANGIRLIPMANGMNSVPFKGRDACIYDGWCAVGCPTGALANPVVSYLGEARKIWRGSARLEQCHARVDQPGRQPRHRRRILRRQERAPGAGGERRRAGRVVGAKSAYPAQLGDRQASEGPCQFQNELVGKFMMTHHIAGTWALFDEDITPHMGTVGAQFMSYDRYAKTSYPGAFGSSFIAAGTSHKTSDFALARGDLFGAEFAAYMKRAARGLTHMTIFGEDLPQLENRIELISDKDEFGLPMARLIHSFDDDAVALWNANFDQGMKIAKATDAKEILARQGPGHADKPFARRRHHGLRLVQLRDQQFWPDPRNPQPVDGRPLRLPDRRRLQPDLHDFRGVAARGGELGEELGHGGGVIDVRPRYRGQHADHSAAAFECPSRLLSDFSKSSAASAITVPGGKIASAPAFLSAS